MKADFGLAPGMNNLCPSFSRCPAGNLNHFAKAKQINGAMRERKVSSRLRLERQPFGWKSPRPWTESEDALLGTMPDGDLACMINRNRTAIRLRRSSLGIPRRSKRHDWTRKDDLLLGKFPDAQVALLLGVTAEAVKLRRWKSGKAACPRQVRKRPSYR